MVDCGGDVAILGIGGSSPIGGLNGGVTIGKTLIESNATVSINGVAGDGGDKFESIGLVRENN